MDAVGAVDVGMSRRAEHRRVAQRAAAVGMARRIVGRVCLHLDEDASDTVYQQRCPDELARDLVDVPREERPGQGDCQKSCSVSVGAPSPRARGALSGRDLRGRRALPPQPRRAARRDRAPGRARRSARPRPLPCRAGSSARSARRSAARGSPRPRPASAGRRRARRRGAAPARRPCPRGRTCRSRERPFGPSLRVIIARCRRPREPERIQRSRPSEHQQPDQVQPRLERLDPSRSSRASPPARARSPGRGSSPQTSSSETRKP